MENTPLEITPKDIVKLYLGCEFEITTPYWVKVVVVDSVNIDGAGWICAFHAKDDFIEIEPFDGTCTIKPILWDAADLYQTKTHKEIYDGLCKRISDTGGKTYYKTDTPQSLLWAIKNKYDMFDLIENGLAIDRAEYERGLRDKK